MVFVFQLPLCFFLSVLCGDVAAWGTKTHPLRPDCICKSKETKDERVMSRTLNDRICLSTWPPHVMHAGSGERKTSFAFFWSENLSLGRQTDETQGHSSSIQPKLQSNRIHIHSSAYMNGAAQYSSYQKLMVSTLRLFPAATPGSPDITAFSCRPSVTKHCCIITLPTAASDRRQFNCLF